MEFEGGRKRLKSSMEEEGDGPVRDGGQAIVEVSEKEGGDDDMNGLQSEEVKRDIAAIVEKIENYTQTISELLESGKMLFKELSNEFEEKMIAMHKEQVEKWQEKIKELQFIDASNEEADALLVNARYLLQNVQWTPEGIIQQLR